MTNLLHTVRGLASLGFLLGLVPAAACGPTQHLTRKDPVDGALERLCAAPDGTRLTYEGGAETGPRHTLLVDVRKVRPGVLELTSGESKTTLFVGAEAATTPDGRTMLAHPIATGAEWNVGKTWRARVEAVDLSVTVPAGTFQRCVRVVSRAIAPKVGSLDVTYCPGVGRTVWIGDDGAAKRHVARFELVKVEPIAAP